MLAEKFCLVLETIRSNEHRGSQDAGSQHSDTGPRTVSTSPHIPIQLAGAQLDAGDRRECSTRPQARAVPLRS